MVSTIAEEPELQRILLREAMKSSGRYRKAFENHVERFERHSETFFGDLQKQGVIKSGIPIADLFYAWRGALIYRLVAPIASDLRGKDGGIKSEVMKRHAEVLTRMLLRE